MQAYDRSFTPSRKPRSFPVLGVLVAVLVFFAAGLLAYRFLFHRAGEEATALIPSDAVLVATLDITPGPDQVILFNRIKKSMAQEKVTGLFQSWLASSKNGASFMDDIVPQLSTSYAVGIWKKAGAKPTQDPDVVGLITVKSIPAVETAAAKYGTKANLQGMSYYNISSEKMAITFIGNYLVLADRPEVLLRVRSVSRGETESIAHLASYKEARAKLPSSANCMLFVDAPTMVEWSQKYGRSIFSDDTKAVDSNGAPKPDPSKSPVHLSGWATVAMTLRDRGIETVWRFPYDTGNPGARLIGSIAPVDKKLYSRLPGGAYGLLVLSQPGRYYEAKNDSLGLSAEDKKQMDEGLNSFEKETGISIEKDLVAGLKGDLALVVYPAREAMTGIPDGLIILDDANGANPAGMVEKVKSAIAIECKKNDTDAPKFQSVKRNGAEVWTLDEKSQQALRQSSGIEPAPGAPAESDPMKDAGSTEKRDAKGEKKQLLFATIGKSVVVASSQSLLDRDIAAYNSGSAALDKDPNYTTLLKQVPEDSQNVFLMAVPDVMERLRPEMASSYTDPHGPKVDDVVKMFGPRGSGLVFSQGHEGQIVTGNLFVPLDYEDVIHLISLANKQNGKSGSSSPGGTSGL
ncbi:MAG TPA: DUF3352 domain-containing protein [Chthonomonadaceae bacterium]|nr:DUF3352 domain-containing protein [Chthonomonadaceae bacterium]